MVRLATLFLFIGLLAPLIHAQCNYMTATPFFRRSVYEFTLNLVKRINQETESHFIASALSPWTLISAISLGASENTLQEIKDVLKLHPHQCFNNIFFDLARQVTRQRSEPGASMLERSATIFLDESLSVKKKFLDELNNVAKCDSKIVSFANTYASAVTINERVRTVTNEAIDEIVTPNDLEDMLVVMIDAVYFKGAWKIAFPYDDTEIRPFYDSNGQQIGDVSLMYVSGVYNMTSLNQIHAHVLELPYGDDGKYSMLIFLPYDNVTVSAMIDSMKSITLSSIYVIFGTYRGENVNVQIPRIKLTSDINNLKELFIDMGLQTLFDASAANFPGISDYQLSLSNFIQKAHVEVTEEGTVASAASTGMFESRNLPIEFLANKPFLFMIVDRQLQVPIFTGAYSKPSQF